ncbi:hypothetical protein [Planktotalea sp.]|uniref:hypothetical protein n=1 Tax=Planktotalea sp. TaxID=2029877 RepID=UPI003D6B080F
MNYLTLSAALLMGLTTGVHLFVGTQEIMPPILEAATIDPVVKGVALVVWHMITLILACSTVAIAYLARNRNKAMVVLQITLNAGFAVIFLVVNAVMFEALLTMPQWTAFSLITVLMMVSWAKAA